jgi:hypothetical protein
MTPYPSDICARGSLVGFSEDAFVLQQIGLHDRPSAPSRPAVKRPGRTRDFRTKFRSRMTNTGVVSPPEGATYERPVDMHG